MRAAFFSQLIGNQLIVTYGRACPYASLILSTVDNVIANVYCTRFLYPKKIGDNERSSFSGGLRFREVSHRPLNLNYKIAIMRATRLFIHANLLPE